MAARQISDPLYPTLPSSRPVLLFCGALLVFLSIWKGPGGYTDLTEYLDDAERLWTRFDMAVPDDFVETQDPHDPDKILYRPRYNRYAPGLAVISGPLVLLGGRLERWTGREGLRRQITALTIPLLGAAATVLALLLGLELGFHPRIAHWAALMFAFGTPFLTYTRLFFTEITLCFLILLALYSFLRSGRTLPHSKRWLLVCGLALGGVSGCHYGNVWITAILWGAFSTALLFPSQAKFTSDDLLHEQHLLPAALRACLLTIGPALVLGGILWLNTSRYGHPLDTGYYNYDVENQIGPGFISANLRYPAQLLLRVPWLLLALYCGRRLYARQPVLAIGLALAFIVQAAFWTNYQLLGYFPYRYQQTLLALCVPGLFFLGHALATRWPRQGLWSAGVFLAAWNLAFVFSGDDSKSKPFLQHPSHGGWLAYVWYMTPFPKGVIDGYGTPLSGTQVAIFLLLLIAGLELLWFSRPAREASFRTAAEPK